MYRYYKELEDKTSFKTTLTATEFMNNKQVHIPNCPIPTFLWDKYQKVRADLLTVDLLLKSCDEDKLQSQGAFAYAELRDAYYSLVAYQNDNAEIIENHKRTINPTLSDFKYYIQDYLIYINCLSIIFPEHKSFLSALKIKLTQLIKLTNELLIIVLPQEETTFEYTWPNSWYITPSGYLYNSGGLTAHKEGNLIYAYGRIASSFKNERHMHRALNDGTDKPGTIYASYAIPNKNNYDKIKAIYERGYVTYEEFVHYTNMMYHFPQMVISANGETNGNKSYQRNLITLIIGYMAAESCFYQSFSRLSKSSDAENLFYKLNQLTAHDMDDMLIRFCRFHKISRVRDNTISTAAIDGINQFKEYLDKGWTIDIVPPIIYDAYHDRLDEIDLNSQYVKRYLDKSLKEYQGKGRILIKK